MTHGDAQGGGVDRLSEGVGLGVLVPDPFKHGANGLLQLIRSEHWEGGREGERERGREGGEGGRGGRRDRRTSIQDKYSNSISRFRKKCDVLQDSAHLFLG